MKYFGHAPFLVPPAPHGEAQDMKRDKKKKEKDTISKNTNT
jgi:hypothetical protein